MRYVLALVVVALVLVSGAFAGGRASIMLDQTAPTFESEITFTAVGGDRISVECYQQGLAVYVNTGRPGDSFKLGPAMKWATGDADCAANLQRSKGHGEFTTVATVAFTVVFQPLLTIPLMHCSL